MEPISLINSAIVAASVQGSVILWQKREFRGICLYLLLIAVAAVFNVMESLGLLSDSYNVTPVFQLLLGPALFLACSSMINRKISKLDALHFTPALIALAFATYVQIIIVLGTLSRVAYSMLTAQKLHQYKLVLDSERSDADEYSFEWMIWAVALTAVLNLIDLIRLNFQLLIPSELNLMGQALNNGLWLVVIIFVSHKLNTQVLSPATKGSALKKASDKEDPEHFVAIYMALDKQIKSEELYRAERLTLDQLSKITGIQQRDISRAINLNAKKSFNEYINELRIEYVCELLKSQSEQSILALAFQAGFSSKAVFYRAFKHTKGMTPSQFKIGY